MMPQVLSREVVNKILWSTMEDCVGSWEIVWELNSLYPESGEDLHREIAKRIVGYFLDHGLVSLYYERWGRNDVSAIAVDEGRMIIDQDVFWTVPSINEICVKVGSTEKGEEYYNSESIGDLVL